MSAEQIRQARAILTRPEEAVSSVARLPGVSRSTIYKYLAELARGQGITVDGCGMAREHRRPRDSGGRLKGVGEQLITDRI
ncbi:helix-turn-helix domain-containing protein [Nocardia vinacea]|uniref:helix-turn-helix domain-containing protein n=1 Tax=Nocardia vinacea TaxID=96468 RepID=UPI0034051380